MDLHELNPPQRAAVCHQTGPLLVLAGAGSGKTKVITYRIAHLLQQGILARDILGLTFTNKAAKHMRQRLLQLVGRKAASVQLCTFHALGLMIITKEAANLGMQENFCIYDTSDQLSLIRDLLRHRTVADRRLDNMRILQLILRTKKARLHEVEIVYADDYEMAAYELYPHYIEQMRAYNAVDFDDLLLLSEDVLKQEDVRKRWLHRFRHLLVDEYQDTSPEQLALLKVLAGPEQNICAVGDDDQAIYAFRGAQSENILAFARIFPGTKEIILDQNYRSTSNILQSANAVIQHNRHRKAKKLWSELGDGPPVRLVDCADEHDEAAFVTETIRQLHYEGMPYKDMAILYRANHQASLFEQNCISENLPYQLIGGRALFDRKEVKDMLAYMSLLVNPNDDLSLRRIINVPTRGIGPATVEKLVIFAQENKLSLWQALKRIYEIDASNNIKKTLHDWYERLYETRQELLSCSNIMLPLQDLFETLHFEEAILASSDPVKMIDIRLKNLDALKEALKRFIERRQITAQEINQTTPQPLFDEAHQSPQQPIDLLKDFVRSKALLGQKEEEQEQEPQEITLMTIHSAKGLEFPVVFMVGLEEDLLPHKRSVEAAGDLSEERRLCYVGMTRAKKLLFLSHARMRQKHGQAQPRTISRFLDDLKDLPCVQETSRGDKISDTSSEVLAANFFKRMRAQLGIDKETSSS